MKYFHLNINSDQLNRIPVQSLLYDGSFIKENSYRTPIQAIRLLLLVGNY
jgi:hypothetical protein